MNPLPCTISAQQAGEELIGTAGHYQTYVFIECPLPWPKKAFDSERMPLALRQYVKAMKAKRSVQFLCINRGAASASARTAILVYDCTDRSALNHFSEGSANRYCGQEFQVDGLDQVVACLETHWQGDGAAFQGNRSGQTIDQQDIFICTHGMRDKCCAQFGQPFFRDAKRGVEQGELPNTRVWRVSHIGGHRFAPTAISMPDGRYYGRLNFSALKAISTRSGPISQLRSVYRGWGILPPPLQVLEQQLLLNHGWQWLTYEAAYKVLASDTGNDLSDEQVQAELFVRAPNASEVTLYRAKIIRNAAQTYCTKASCGDTSPSTFVKYAVATCSASTHSLTEDLRPKPVSAL